MGRDQVLAAAVEMFRQADLADLLSFLGTRAVAERADVQPATVHHHFHNRDDQAKPNARLAAAVVDACVGDGRPHVATIDALTSVSAGDKVEADELDVLRASVNAHFEALLADRTLAIGVLVGAAASATDPATSELLADMYEKLCEEYSSVLGEVVERLGRRFDADHGFTAETSAVIGRAVTDGLVLRHQFDPDPVSAELYGEICLRLIEVLTVPADGGDDDDGDGELVTDAVTDRLLRRSSTLELPAESGLDAAKRSRIVEAIRQLYEEQGVRAMTVTAVAREANVSRGTVIANFGDRNGLAAVVWAAYLPDLERRLEADRARDMPLERVLERHLHRVVDLSKGDTQLTALLLDGIIGHTIRHGPPTYMDPTDPRSSVPLPALLVPVLQDAADQLRPGLADTPANAKDLAASITNMTMVRTMSRPDETTSDTVQRIIDLFLDGILQPEG